MATTSFSLGDHWEAFIRAEVASGRYGSASEVVRDGLRALEDRKRHLEALRATWPRAPNRPARRIRRLLARRADRRARPRGMIRFPGDGLGPALRRFRPRIAKAGRRGAPRDPVARSASAEGEGRDDFPASANRAPWWPRKRGRPWEGGRGRICRRTNPASALLPAPRQRPARSDHPELRLNPSFRLTPRARADLRSIGRYTQVTWGRAQRDLYLAALDHRFHWLAEAPRRGRPRPDIGEGYYCFPKGCASRILSHPAGGIDVIGIPHQAMDIAAHLSGTLPCDRRDNAKSRPRMTAPGPPGSSRSSPRCSPGRSGIAHRARAGRGALAARAPRHPRRRHRPASNRRRQPGRGRAGHGAAARHRRRRPRRRGERLSPRRVAGDLPLAPRPAADQDRVRALAAGRGVDAALRTLRGGGRAGAAGARDRGGLDRRLRHGRRRDRRDGLDRRLRPAYTARPGQPRVDGGGIVLRRPLGVPALHPPDRVGRSADPRGAALGTPRTDRRMAARPGGEADAGTPSRPLAGPRGSHGAEPRSDRALGRENHRRDRRAEKDGRP